MLRVSLDLLSANLGSHMVFNMVAQDVAVKYARQQNIYIGINNTAPSWAICVKTIDVGLPTTSKWSGGKEYGL